MCGVTYIVTVCDGNPLYGTDCNIIEYRFSRKWKAHRFMEDAMSRGYFAVAHRADITCEVENG